MTQIPNLLGKVAVVTGARHGAGRGIALALGEAGATVYVTGRSLRGNSKEKLPGSIEETAEAVTRLGGLGIPVRCDHAVDAEVEALFQRVRSEQGRLDLLVNNVWSGYEQYEFDSIPGPFWKQPLCYWNGTFAWSVRAHLIAARFAALLMLGQRGGVIINTVAKDQGLYLGNLLSYVAKSAVIRISSGIAEELRPYGIAALALDPGFMLTERAVAAHAVQTYSPNRVELLEYIGRSVAFLAADPQVMQKTGKVLKVGDLVQEYGFMELMGS
jgi:NAD(P)-dependent dehydrogenase (short-subunit alcohol dehydrogenase family)